MLENFDRQLKKKKAFGKNYVKNFHYVQLNSPCPHSYHRQVKLAENRRLTELSSYHNI